MNTDDCTGARWTCPCQDCREWRENREPDEPDGESFRGTTEAAAYRAAQQLVARRQRG